MGTLKVKLSGQEIFSTSGDQGNKWHMKQITLNGKGAKKVSPRFCLLHGDMVLKVAWIYVWFLHYSLYQ